MFVKQHITDLTWASDYDLYVMDSDGCYARFVLPGASGSPAWSRDGKYFAIGCENNTSLCILDAPATFASCSGEGDEVGQCSPVIQQRHSLPLSIAGPNYLYGLSWAPEGSQLVITGGDTTSGLIEAYALSLPGGDWRKLLTDNSWWFRGIDWNPQRPLLVTAGLHFMDVDGGNVQDGPAGASPDWSPDGSRLAFVKRSDDDTMEGSGIASFDLATGKAQWLYAPVKRDDYTWPPQNLSIHDDRSRRLLSWSPDGDYIAFVSTIYSVFNSQIFRLNIATGEIAILTNDLFHDYNENYFFAPAWGP